MLDACLRLTGFILGEELFLPKAVCAARGEIEHARIEPSDLGRILSSAVEPRLDRARHELRVGRGAERGLASEARATGSMRRSAPIAPRRIDDAIDRRHPGAAELLLGRTLADRGHHQKIAGARRSD